VPDPVIAEDLVLLGAEVRLSWWGGKGKMSKAPGRSSSPLIGKGGGCRVTALR